MEQSHYPDSERLRRSLQPGERLLWFGWPQQGIVFRSSDFFLIPFSLLWGGFAIFWEASVLSPGNAPVFFPIFGGFFVLVGLYFIFGRFLVDAYVRRRTVYGVTSQRILITSYYWGEQSRSLFLFSLPEITLTEHGDERGTIVFGSQNARIGLDSWTPSLSGNRALNFERITDTQKVMEIIRKTQKESRQPT